jgi:YidC/Oxa1 family membrane protein insertase
MLVLANIFQPLITVFETVLKFFHNSGGIPWGWSIVLLTACIRLVLVPLAVKQYHSMRGMQQLAPQMKELQQKYKDDKQRQQQEMMRLYKENNVNPFASCLPLVLQLPVLISLYYMLRESLRRDICPAIQTSFQHAYALKHHVSLHAAAGQTTACGSHGAGFLFIPDLTAKATGPVLIGLIVLYVGTQLASQLLMATPQMDKTQQRMMMLLPLVFIIFIINFPAGVIVYWITTNLWTITQQWVIRRRLGPATPAVATVGAAGVTGRAAGAPAAAGGGASARGLGRNALKAGANARAEKNGAGENGPAPASTPAPGLGRGSSSARSAAAEGNGGGEDIGSSAGPAGLVGALRRRKEPAPEAVSAAARRAAPPPPPRKKKKRSGRRR